MALRSCRSQAHAPGKASQARVLSAAVPRRTGDAATSSTNPLSSLSAIGPNTAQSQASAISQIATDKEVYLAVGNIAGQRAFVFVNQLTNEITVQDVQSGQVSHLASTPGLRDHEDFAMWRISTATASRT